jgi:hypothetical protein
MRARVRFALTILLALFILPLGARAALYAFEERPASWRTADWSSVGMLPDAAAHREARVLVFSGRTGGWKGLVSVHSWVVLKPAGARDWRRYDVVGWGQPVRRNGWAADGRWYGDVPTVIADVRGAQAERVIPKIEAAIQAYRYANRGDYRMWPGPNSNTFVAAVLRAVPELGVTLPPTAVGKDFRDQPLYLGPTDSRSGLEFGLLGVLGVKLGWIEGLEINVMGLVAGLDIRQPALKLPAFGRIGTGFPLARAAALSDL